MEDRSSTTSGGLIEDAVTTCTIAVIFIRSTTSRMMKSFGVSHHLECLYGLAKSMRQIPELVGIPYGRGKTMI